MSLSSPQRVRIAVDAMGGDFAPEEVVKAAIQAAGPGDVELLLVGDPRALEAESRRHPFDKLPIRSIPSDGVIQEGESPVQALRQKPKASVVVATGLVKAGQADACVTMGSTGAAMAAATLLLGTLEGIERPALGGPILGLAPQTVIIDLGTNLDCRPAQLLQFGVIGMVFATKFLGVAAPRVALLSVGSEEGKGNRQVRETYELFKQSGLNFVGNIEGHDLPRGKAEVVVCDGFVGNILMKYSEGVGEALAERLRTSLKGQLRQEDLEPHAQEVYDLLNGVERSGGGPLFGVRGVVVIGHGRSRAPVIANAIRTAKLAVDVGFVAALQEELGRIRERVKL